MLFPSCINKNGTAEISAAPEKKAQNTTDACPSSPTLSFYLRDSAANAALHLRYSLLSFSRATSILSPHPVRRAPESFTPSAGFRRFPKNFVCRFLNCGTTIPLPRIVVNTIFRQFVRLRATHILAIWTKEPSVYPTDGSAWRKNLFTKLSKFFGTYSSEKLIIENERHPSWVSFVTIFLPVQYVFSVYRQSESRPCTPRTALSDGLNRTL